MAPRAPALLLIALAVACAPANGTAEHPAPIPGQPAAADHPQDDLAWVVDTWGEWGRTTSVDLSPEVLAEGGEILARAPCEGCLPEVLLDDLAAILVTGAVLHDDWEGAGRLLRRWIPDCASACSELAGVVTLAFVGRGLDRASAEALLDAALPRLSTRDAVTTLAGWILAVEQAEGEGALPLEWRRDYLSSLSYDPGVRGRFASVLGAVLDGVVELERRETEELFSLLRTWNAYHLAGRLAELSPHADLKHWIQAWGHSGAGDWNKARLSLSAWQRGGVAEHHLAEHHSLAARTAARQGRREDALSHLEEMAAHGGGEDGLYRMAGYLTSLGRPAEAEDTYRRYLERYPDGDRADLVRYHLFRVGVEDEPLAAMAWLDATTDPDLAPIRLYWRWRILDDTDAREGLLTGHPLSYWALYEVRREGLGAAEWWSLAFPEEGVGGLGGDPLLARLEAEMPAWALAEAESMWRGGDRRLSVGTRLARLYAEPDRQRERQAVAGTLVRSPARGSLDRLSQEALMDLAWPDPWPGPAATAAAAAGLPKALSLGVARQESAFNQHAVSSAGAEGLMQLMPATAQAVAAGLGDQWTPVSVFDPATNLRWGSTYLAGQLDRRGGDLPAALVAYNAGPSRADPWRAAHPVASYQDEADPLRLLTITLTETRLYARAVLANRWIYGYMEDLAD